jgi:hypothetical protein
MTENAPAGCQSHECGVRTIFGALRDCITNDTGAVLFRCDGDNATNDLFFVADSRDHPDPMGGPQFRCRQRLDILPSEYTSNCKVHITEFDWTGTYLCP